MSSKEGNFIFGRNQFPSIKVSCDELVRCGNVPFQTCGCSNKNKNGTGNGSQTLAIVYNLNKTGFY